MTPTARPLLPVLFALVALLAACGGGEERQATPTASTTTSTAPTPTRTPAAGATPGACIDEGEGPEPSAAALGSFVRQRSRKLRECYQRVLKRDASARGRLTVRFTIDRCGRVKDAQIASRSGNLGEAPDCALALIQRWRTPFNPAEPVTIEYPIAFSASM